MQELTPQHKMWLTVLAQDWHQEPTLERVFEKAEKRSGQQFKRVAREVTGPSIVPDTEKTLIVSIERDNPDADALVVARQILDELRLYASR